MHLIDRTGCSLTVYQCLGIPDLFLSLSEEQKRTSLQVYRGPLWKQTILQAFFFLFTLI